MDNKSIGGLWMGVIAVCIIFPICMASVTVMLWLLDPEEMQINVSMEGGSVHYKGRSRHDD